MDSTSDTAAGQDSTGPDAGGEASAGGGEDEATAYIAAELRRLRLEREQLQERLGAVQDRERTLWADARRAGVSFGRIGDVSGVDRATVYYALNPRGASASRRAKRPERTPGCEGCGKWKEVAENGGVCLVCGRVEPEGSPPSDTAAGQTEGDSPQAQDD